MLNRSPVYVGEKQEDDYDSVQRIQERKAQEEKLREERKKDEMRRMHDEVKYHLDMQIREKKARQENEKLADHEHHKTLVRKAEEHDEAERLKAEHKSLKKQEFRDNLLLQMGIVQP